MSDDQPTKWVDIDSVQYWSKNPNQGNIGAIIVSITNFGFNDTCQYWNGVVKGGNHSIMALQQLRKSGWHPDKCKHDSKCLQVDNGTWNVAMIDNSDMDATTSDAFGIAINRTQRLGHDDPVAMLVMLEEIRNSDIPLQSTGYDVDDMDELARDIDPANNVVFQEYDESIADTVEYHDCPNCGHKFPK